ncbi:hypothetical protein WI91_01630 [Burkholderia vietnamiensis]|uniref:Uncharacterized protein n=1 Tax=Burkholderia vietnamiensis TaxID=60552 RepID=A0AA44Y3G7_BURVI|nr:hypothetical protein WL96_14715 [Burkholderia vietnamiensis]AVR16133.1 hypothetical protein A8H33_22460 [Burkholderia vietnamiensis]KVE03346.1 hypothetical protein WI91_01630 [Burkholderia vietnamiensis]KVF08115.1 hypothetical protein WJ05_20935 [Burkholderia vietnamiensis]KVF40510.1 hypothetical protein WJ09_25355 [Burkholderia vietnamiensis]
MRNRGDEVRASGASRSSSHVCTAAPGARRCGEAQSRSMGRCVCAGATRRAFDGPSKRSAICDVVRFRLLLHRLQHVAVVASV